MIFNYWHFSYFSSVNWWHVRLTMTLYIGEVSIFLNIFILSYIIYLEILATKEFFYHCWLISRPAKTWNKVFGLFLRSVTLMINYQSKKQDYYNNLRWFTLHSLSATLHLLHSQSKLLTVFFKRGVFKYGFNYGTILKLQ